MTSYAEQNGAWRDKKINLMSVFKSFISQLRPGQELTKISLPTVLCYPFSMLEFVGQRELANIDVLFKLDGEENPLKRMLLLVRWYLTIVKKETIEKKPYNPVKGETHFSWVEHERNINDDFDGHDNSEFISEQVSHHPPITAFTVRNRKRDIEIWSNCSFSVKFGGNSATVVTSGPAEVRLGSGETYFLSKTVPDMVIQNVVWGTKYIIWNGGVTIECPETGYMAQVNLTEKSKNNRVAGWISKMNAPDDIIYEFSGMASDLISYNKPGSRKKRPLLDFTTITNLPLQYPNPDLLPPLSSYHVWKDVNQAIIDDDMSRADDVKKVIEQEQRDRIREEGEHTAFHYELDQDGMWHFLNNISLQQYWEEKEIEPSTTKGDEESSDSFRSVEED